MGMVHSFPVVGPIIGEVDGHNRRQAGRQRDEQEDIARREIDAAEARERAEAQRQVEASRVQLQREEDRIRTERDINIPRRGEQEMLKIQLLRLAMRCCETGNSELIQHLRRIVQEGGETLEVFKGASPLVTAILQYRELVREDRIHERQVVRHAAVEFLLQRNFDYLQRGLGNVDTTAAALLLPFDNEADAVEQNLARILLNRIIRDVVVAIDADGLVKVKELIELDPDSLVNMVIPETDGWTPFIKVCDLGKLAMVRTFFEQTDWLVDVNKQDISHKTAFDHALEQAHKDVVVEFINRRAIALTEFEVACKDGNLETVDRLLGEGAIVSQQDNRPVVLAAMFGHAAIVARLQEADGTVISARNGAVLRAACCSGDEVLVQNLLRAGVDMFLPTSGNKYSYELGDKSNSHWKRFFAEEEVRRELAGRGHRSSNGDTFLHMACYNGDEILVQVLLQAGANMLAVNNLRQYPYELGNKVNSHWKRFFAEEDVRRELVGRGCRDVNDCTFLHIACYNLDEVLIQSLFHAGVVLNIRNNAGRLASEMGLATNLARLRAMFTEENSRRRQEALQELHRRCDRIREDGSNLNGGHPGYPGYSFLTYYVGTGELEMVSLLMKAGVDLTISDSRSVDVDSMVETIDCTARPQIRAQMAQLLRLGRVLPEAVGDLEYINYSRHQALQELHRRCDSIREDGSNLNAVHPEHVGETFLTHYAGTGDTTMMQLFIAARADLGGTNSRGVRPADMATTLGGETRVRMTRILKL